MGNDQSQFAGTEIDEKAIEVSDFWTQHSAVITTLPNVTNLSVFIGELLVSGPLWKSQTPLEKNSKNLMIYRHPCILKYVSSWQKSSKYYLAVEDVKPLAHVLPSLNELQICIGLHSILKALCFLHETAQVSHNNVCSSSIYVASDGNWKLGGMEYLCKFSDITSDFLNKSKSSRYNKAIDDNEVKSLEIKANRRDTIDVYAFGVLVCELLRSKNEDTVPSLSDFLTLCKNELQNSNVTLRPKLISLLNHEFFNHKFIAIHSFLIELPLKSDDERTEFFSSLLEKLKEFNEVTVAKELSSLLLSRMVLLNKTANTELLPVLLTPRKDGDEDKSKGLFTLDTFKTYVSPKLKNIFCVRDAQIRLLLLNNFHNFVETFTKEDIQTCILPELLLGIKDTSDHLVSVTLRSLADLVPLLGAATVIGGKRAKLFNDGRPITHPGRKLSRPAKRSEFIPPEADLTATASNSSNSLVQLNFGVDLSERQRPDGEEGETSTEEIEQSVDEDLDNWEDWDINEGGHQSMMNSLNAQNDEPTSHTDSTAVSMDSEPVDLENVSIQISNMEITRKTNQQQIVDITELDIKNQLGNGKMDEIDFFQDMEPVIESTNKFLVSGEDGEKKESEEFSSKLTLSATDVKEEGWGDDEWD
ncbi:protein-associating with the carboxyl-terminal domain of ezrin [Aethina tumida]|uniref:protein-associating with the carboxyl-terminal domain of ezrin n=1 Tax=Aethina tumida TaxID=116153 RepID=UPI00096B2426|nr:protein-associating with the carboxyl-terminal domain of ezrin [Aethina tumida]